MFTANGHIFPGRDNTTAKSIFISCKGDDLETSRAVTQGSADLDWTPGPSPQTHTAISPLDTGSVKGPASCSPISLSTQRLPLPPAGTSPCSQGSSFSPSFPLQIEPKIPQGLPLLCFVKVTSIVTCL